ncbi:MAG: uridine kinase family protein [Acidimicrobiales bacterium]
MSFVIGIGGGSGSGKSTVAELVARSLEPRSVSIVHLDRFFKPPDEMPTYHSTLHNGPRPDFNHPRSFDLTEMLTMCRSPTGDQVVIMEGILALHFDELRALMDLRCYVTIEIDEMLRRRTARNLAAGYGGTANEIDFYNRDCVQPQHLRFNRPSADHAEVLIPNDGPPSAERERAILEICRRVRARSPDRS